MPKDISSLDDTTGDHSPIRGLSDAAYQEIVASCRPAAELSKSPVGGLSLPEYLRIAGQAD